MRDGAEAVELGLWQIFDLGSEVIFDLESDFWCLHSAMQE